MPSETVAPLIAIVGPTGSGKSDLALRLARLLDGEIVNCDSLQVYRHFDAGTAKLPAEERGGTPHHLIDVVDPGDVFTAGDYARLSRHALEEITVRGRLPLIVGGTGFYLATLLDGLAPGPVRDDGLRKRLQALEVRRTGALHRLLRRFDPQTASRVHPNDVQKLVRAVEICLRARRPASDVFGQGRDSLAGYQVLKIGLDPDRAALYDRLNARADRMFRHGGLVEEVRSLLAAGYPPECKPFQSLGYKQALRYLGAELSLDEAIESTQKETRHYAKRQWTWFRRDPAVVWLQGFGSEAEIRGRALAISTGFLAEFTKMTFGSASPFLSADRI